MLIMLFLKSTPTLLKTYLKFPSEHMATANAVLGYGLQTEQLYFTLDTLCQCDLVTVEEELLTAADFV